MQAAEHGADFPMAEKLRKSMSHEQLHEFAVGSEANKPEHVAHHSPPEAYPTPLIKGMTNDIMHSNMQSLRSNGMSEADATAHAIRASKGFTNPMEPVKKVYRNQHLNLGKHLIPRKDGKPHGSDYGAPDAGPDQFGNME